MSTKGPTEVLLAAGPPTEPLNCVASSNSLLGQKKKLCRVTKGYNLEDSSKLLGIIVDSRCPQILYCNNRDNGTGTQFCSTPTTRALNLQSRTQEHDYEISSKHVRKEVGGVSKLGDDIVSPLHGQISLDSDAKHTSRNVARKLEIDQYEMNKENDVTQSLISCANSARSSTNAKLRRVFFSNDVIVHRVANDGDVSEDLRSSSPDGSTDSDLRRLYSEGIEYQKSKGSEVTTESVNRWLDSQGMDCEKSISIEDSDSGNLSEIVAESTNRLVKPDSPSMDENKKHITSSPPTSKTLCQIIQTHLAERRKKPPQPLKIFSSTTSTELSGNLSNRDINRTTTNRSQPKLHRLSRSKASDRVASSSMEHRLVVGAGSTGEMLQLFVSLDRHFAPDDIIVRTSASGYDIRVTSENHRRRCSSDCGDEHRHAPALNETFVLPVPIDTTWAVANLSPQGCLLIQAPIIIRGYRTTSTGNDMKSSFNRSSENCTGYVRISHEKRLQFIL